MDLVIENVGRRSETWGNEGDPTDVGDASLNGYERNALYWNRGNGRFDEVAYLVHADRIEDGRGVARAGAPVYRGEGADCITTGLVLFAL